MVVLERLIKHVLRFVARRAERQTIFQLAFIHDMQGCLDRDRIDLAEDRVDQRFQCDLRFGCLTDVAVEIIVDHAAVGCRDEIGNGRDAAAAAQREDRHRLVIVAGINAEILTDVRGKPTDLRNIAGCLLETDDIRMLLERSDCACIHVDTCAGGYGIHDDRCRDCVSDFLEMGNQTRLGTFIIVRGDDEQPIDAERFDLLRQRQGALCTVAAGACDDRNSACSQIDGELRELHLFFG